MNERQATDDPWVAVYHIGGPPHQPGCNKPAFEARASMTMPGAYVQSAKARHLDGRRMEHMSEPRCDSCGGRVWFSSQILSMTPLPEVTA